MSCYDWELWYARLRAYDMPPYDMLLFLAAHISTLTLIAAACEQVASIPLQCWTTRSLTSVCIASMISAVLTTFQNISTAQHSTAQHSTAQHSTAHFKYCQMLMKTA